MLVGYARSCKLVATSSHSSINSPAHGQKLHTVSASSSGDSPTHTCPPKYLPPSYQSPGKDLTSRTSGEIGINLQILEVVPQINQKVRCQEVSFLRSRDTHPLPPHNTLFLCCNIALGCSISPSTIILQNETKYMQINEHDESVPCLFSYYL